MCKYICVCVCVHVCMCKHNNYVSVHVVFVCGVCVRACVDVCVCVTCVSM